MILFERLIQKTYTMLRTPGGGSGWAQEILTKVVANIKVVVSNLVFKYVEDDVVATFKVGNVELSSTNGQWEPDFVVTSHIT